MSEQTLTQKAQALNIGTIGGMYAYVSRKDIPEWPEGAVGLSFGEGPFIIFDQDINWTRNPSGHDRRERILMGSPLYEDWRSHMKAQLKVLKTVIHNPMNAYLMVSHLFMDGFSLVRHYNWASYLMDRVAQLLQSPRVINELLQTEESIEDGIEHNKDVYD